MNVIIVSDAREDAGTPRTGSDVQHLWCTDTTEK
jgi:hypothetical protein